MAGTVTVTGMAAGLLGGQNTIGPLTVTGSAVVGQRVDVTLASGDNTVSIPTTATAVVVVASSSNTATLKVRTVNGDTGATVAKTGLIYVAAFDSASRPTTLYVNASGTGGSIEVTFI